MCVISDPWQPPRFAQPFHPVGLLFAPEHRERRFLSTIVLDVCSRLQ